MKLWEAETFRPEDEAFGAGRFMLIIASSLTLHFTSPTTCTTPARDADQAIPTSASSTSLVVYILPPRLRCSRNVSLWNGVRTLVSAGKFTTALLLQCTMSSSTILRADGTSLPISADAYIRPVRSLTIRILVPNVHKTR